MATKERLEQRIAQLEAEMAAIEGTKEYKWGWLTPWTMWFELDRQRTILRSLLDRGHYEC